MKRTTKVILIIASVLAASGLCVAIIGLCLGGGPRIVQWAMNGDLSFGPMDLMGWNFEMNVVDIDWEDEQTIYSGTVDKTKIQGAREVQNLDVEIGGSILQLEFSEDQEFYFSSSESAKYQCYIEDDILYLKSEGDFNIGRRDNEITLYVPKDWAYSQISIELGAGSIDIEDGLRAESVEIEVGAGKLTAESVEAERLFVEIGAGMVDLSGVQAQAAELEVGMGQLIFDGNITGDMLAECAMGSMEFAMDTEEETHNYELECAMGTLKVGSHSYSGMANEHYIDHGAASVYELSCSMGEIKMNFR